MADRQLPLRQHLPHRDRTGRKWRVDVESIVTGHFGLDESEAALRAGIDDEGAIKVVVYPQYAHTGGVAPAALAR